MPTRRALALCQIALAVLFAASFIVFGLAADFPLPYRDDWAFLRAVTDRPLTVATLLAPVNEHVIPLTRLLTAVHYRLEGTTGHLIAVVALAFQFVTAAILAAEVRRRWRDDRDAARLIVASVVVLLTFAYQLQSIVFDAAVMFPMVETFAVAAIVMHLRAMEAANGDTRRRWTAGAVLLTFGALASTTNGLIVPWILALMTALDRRRLRTFALWLGIGIASAIVYWIVEGQFAAAAMAGRAQPSVGLMLGYTLAFFASFIAYAGSAAAVLVGGIIVAAMIVACWTTARDWSGAHRLERLSAGMMLFGLLSAAMSAPSRAHFGIIQGAQSRYATLTVACWAALLIFACSRWLSARTIARPRPALVMVLGALVLLPVQALSGMVWLAKADDLRADRLALVTGVRDDARVAELGPPAPVALYALVARFKEAGDRTLTDARLDRPFADSVTHQCDATLQLTDSDGSATDWRLTGSVTGSETSALIVDRAGIVRGLARPAPITPEENPRPWDVVRATVHHLLSGRDGAQPWLGYAKYGAGPPYTVYGLVGGQPVCSAGIAGGLR